ncbi:universal stress protein [Nocardioides sp. CER19]|uniref:universal stress protein n=1 Tax=Nocardioides sp. CER19 TaxID=3038538 RepID=UPI002448757D|nr:universal stress protein [Nocardioides sp. CER19]MDH2416622.1 universal stress protein [Nocardioides sp. CER19]
MTGRIVVGIDGSPQSANALEWAVARARLGDHTLELVNAYNMPSDFDFYGFHALPGAQPVEWFTEYSQELLAAAEKRVQELAPDLSCTLTSTMGPAAYALSDASAGADAVVVGRRGLGAATSVLLGSVSNRLTIEAKCPLIVVSEGELPTSGPIVVGVDGSEFGTAALRYAVAEAAVRGTSVRAVTAYQVPDQRMQADAELLARMRAAFEDEAADITRQALSEAQGGDAVTVDTVTVEGRAADAILGNAGDAQLIVVGSHGKGLVRRVLLGSVSRRVLHDADRPVAVIDLPED